MRAITPVLYKYYPPERIDILTNWTVRFSSPSQFNDVFDTNWEVEAKAEKQVVRRFRNSLGIFSLSEDGNNHLMWVHYADQRRGFVVGFKSHAKFLTEGEGELKKVQYGREPRDFIAESTEWPWHKDKDWEYEKEWHCVRRIKTGQPRDIPFEPDDISEIIIGSEMSDGDINLILGFAEAMKVMGDNGGDGSASLRLRLAKPDLPSRTIKLHECRWTLCQSCNGRGRIEE